MTTKNDAAVRLLEQFGRTAARLVPGDVQTQNDLSQHMAVAVLLSGKPIAKLGYYAKLGESRARDYLRKGHVRGRMDLKLRAVAKRERM